MAEDGVDQHGSRVGPPSPRASWRALSIPILARRRSHFPKKGGALARCDDASGCWRADPTVRQVRGSFRWRHAPRVRAPRRGR